MNLKQTLESAIDEFIKPYKKLKQARDFLYTDPEIISLLEISNSVTVHRLGYNDHGPVHARAVAFNSLKAMKIIYDKEVLPTIMSEFPKADFEDALEIVFISGFLHDIGNSIIRDDHELFGVICGLQILDRFYKNKNELNLRKRQLILESILCHMGSRVPSSLEAKIIPIADSCDMESGRARLPYQLGKKDIHSLSALAIKKVRITPGVSKPLQIQVDMDSSAGIFQIEELLIKKIISVHAENLVHITARIESRNETLNYL